MMKEETASFYSAYSGQTWKNVLSIGDMEYERDAVNELTFRRKKPFKKSEHIRTKTIVLPTGPSISEITNRLKISRPSHPSGCILQRGSDLTTLLLYSADQTIQLLEPLNLLSHAFQPKHSALSSWISRRCPSCGRPIFEGPEAWPRGHLQS